jgi:hypothetical protein
MTEAWETKDRSQGLPEPNRGDHGPDADWSCENVRGPGVRWFLSQHTARTMAWFLTPHL